MPLVTFLKNASLPQGRFRPGMKVRLDDGVVDELVAADAVTVLTDPTDGTVAANDPVIADANKDVTGFRNVTATGLVSAGTVMAKKVVTAAAADGALVIADGVVKITKAGVAALTLADPASGDEGTVMIITAATANAHTVSNAAGSGFNSGGASADVATFGGAIGDSLVIVAIAQKWHVISLRNVTLG